MKVCIVGLGSIGRRHLRNLACLFQSRGIEFAIDALRHEERDLPPERELLHKIYYNINQLPDDYDAAFICNPTSMHYDTIRALAGKTRHMFIEKPVFDRSGYDINALDLPEDGIYYVACPLRYCSALQWVKDYIQNERIYAVRAICSTYLPDWRPDVDYRKIYSAHADMGGGVSIDLIHEWDYLCWLFGWPQRVLHMRGTYSQLEIDSDDLSLYLASYPDKLISLHLDYFGRFERREMELYTQRETVLADIRRGKISFLKTGETICLTEERDSSQKRELAHFFDIIAGLAANDNSLANAAKTLRLAEGKTP